MSRGIYTATILLALFAAVFSAAPKTCGDLKDAASCIADGASVNGTECGWCARSGTCDACIDADCKHAKNDSLCEDDVDMFIDWFPHSVCNTAATNSTPCVDLVADCLQFSFSKSACIKQKESDGYYCGYSKNTTLVSTAANVTGVPVCWYSAKENGAVSFAETDISVNIYGIVTANVTDNTGIAFRGGESNTWIIAVAVGACIAFIIIVSASVYCYKKRKAATYQAFD